MTATRPSPAEEVTPEPGRRRIGRSRAGSGRDGRCRRAPMADGDGATRAGIGVAGEDAAVTTSSPMTRAGRAERDEYLDALRRAAGRLRELQEAGDQAADRAGRRGPPTSLVEKLLPVLDTARPGHRPIGRRRVGRGRQGPGGRARPCCSTCWPRRASSGSTRLGEPLRPDRPRRGGPCRRRATARAGPEPVVERGAAGRATAGGARRAPPGHGRRCTEEMRTEHMAPQREWFEKDYYKVLGRVRTATDKEITSAYRKLAKQYHPDANPGSRGAASRRSPPPTTCSATPTKRKEYDEVRRLGPRPPASACRPGGAGGGRASGSTTWATCGDIFGGLFGAAAAGGRTPRGPQRGADVETELHLSFEDAVQRGHHHGQRDHRTPAATPAAAPAPRRARARRPARAAAAAASSTTTRACSPSARSARSAAAGARWSSTPCPTCHGHGRRAPQPAGEGADPGRRRGRPAHPGQGARARPGAATAPPGDLYVVVHVGPPPDLRPPGPQPDPDRARSPSPRRPWAPP